MISSRGRRPSSPSSERWGLLMRELRAHILDLIAGRADELRAEVPLSDVLALLEEPEIQAAIERVRGEELRGD